MSVTARHREILRQLLADGYVEAKALAARLDVDASTIRRDLDALVRAGQAQRTHGGARPMPGAALEVPYDLKRAERQAEKAAIAAAAVAQVRDGDSVILDSGSTTYAVAVALRQRKHLTVLTNVLRIAKFVAVMPETRLLVTGGELLGSVFTLVGERAVDFLSDYHVDWAFLGADAVHPEAGVTNTNTLEVPLKRAMIAAAATTIVVADSSKFGHRSLTRIAAVEEVGGLVTDDGLGADEAAAYGTKLQRVASQDTAAP